MGEVVAPTAELDSHGDGGYRPIEVAKRRRLTTACTSALMPASGEARRLETLGAEPQQPAAAAIGCWKVTSEGRASGVKFESLGLGSGDTGVLEQPRACDQAADSEATENSSSFGDSFCSDCEDPGEMEVESGVFVDELERACSSGFNGVSRKKKLTDEWRSFIRPVMWRCRWIELRMHELYSQALKYDQELSKYAEENYMHSTMAGMDDPSTSVRSVCARRKKQSLKRMRRKRHEDAVDISAYMSRHNIFSYFEIKKSKTNCHLVKDDVGDLVMEKIRDTEDVEGMNEWLKSCDSENNSLEQMLLGIDDYQSRVLKMKASLNQTKHSCDLSSSAQLCGPAELPACFESPSHSYSFHGNDECKIPFGPSNASPHDASGYETEDAAFLGSLHTETDIFENEEDMNDVLISNSVGEEFQDIGMIGCVALQPSVVVNPEAASELGETGIRAEDPQPLPVMKPCYTGKRRGRKPKRKRSGGGSGDRDRQDDSDWRPQKCRSSNRMVKKRGGSMPLRAGKI